METERAGQVLSARRIFDLVREDLEQVEKATVNRRRRFGRQLLIDDRPAEGVEVRPEASHLVATGSDLGDELRKNGIGFPEVVDGFADRRRGRRHAGRYSGLFTISAMTAPALSSGT